MIETRGKVKRIIGRTARNGKDYWLVILNTDDGVLFAWDRELVDKVYEGDRVSIRYEEGKYPNILKLDLHSKFYN